MTLPEPLAGAGSNGLHRVARLFKKPASLPLPPPEMRALVGIRESEGWDHPPGRLVFPTVTRREQYEMVFDFGCGCGRVARQLAQARAPLPRRYLGVDLHAGMVAWCNEHLAPRLPGFAFEHHNVHNPGLNPDPALPRMLPLPIEDGAVSLLVAVSVFTHLTQEQAEFYLREVARALRADGVMVATFFLFDKRPFPMMQEFQHALYINPDDPSNAVIFDREWLLTRLTSHGLAITSATPPEIRGFQWTLEIRPGQTHVPLGGDDAPIGHRAPPVPERPAHEVGAAGWSEPTSR